MHLYHILLYIATLREFECGYIDDTPISEQVQFYF